MLLKIDLFNLLPTATTEEFVRFDQQVTQRFCEVVETYGRRYLGVFRPEGMSGYSIAEASLIEAETPEEAQARAAAAPKPDDFIQIVTECRAYQQEEYLTLWLKPIIPSPYASKRLSLEGGLIRVFMYHPHPEKTYEDFERFERRITTRYSEFLGQINWFYTGTYDVYGMPEAMRADVDIVQAASLDEALARDAALTEPPEIQEIIAECRGFMNRERERSTFWLHPLSLSASAQAGVLLAP